MVLNTLLGLFFDSIVSKDRENKREANTFLNKNQKALTVLDYLNKDYVTFADNSAPAKKIAEYLNKDIREVELCLNILIEKNLTTKVITKSELYPVKYSITVLGRNVMTERTRKEKLRTKNNIPNKNKFEQNIPINFGQVDPDENLSFEIGEAFENFVAEKLFPDNRFILTHRTPSFEMNNKRFCESSLKPDLGFRDKKTGKEFYVECKFRGSLNEDGKYNWTKDKDQANRYRNIQKNENKQVFVAMGLGGMSDDPRNIFLVPIDEIKYLELYPSVLQNWEVYNIYDIFNIINS